MHPLHFGRLVRMRLRGVVTAFDGVRVDRHSRIQPRARLAHHVELLDTTIQRYTSVGRYAKCHYADIGPFCSIAWDVTIGATGHPLDRLTSHAFPYRKAIGGFISGDIPIARPRVVLGADVWVGARVIVMPGVKVATGAVLGAGAIVTSDVEPYAVMVGAPARRRGFRIPEELIAETLALAWWSWPDEVIRAHAWLFQSQWDAALLARAQSIYHPRQQPTT